MIQKGRLTSAFYSLPSHAPSEMGEKMGYVDELRFFWNMLWNPVKCSKRKLDLGGALKLYYTLAILPFIVYIVFGVVAASLGVSAGFGMSSPFHAFRPFVTSLSYFAVIAGAVVLFFIAIPLSIAIDALIYQLIGRMFLNVWKGKYEKTFTALMFGILPMLALLWLSFIPFLNAIFIVIAPIWTIIVFTAALSVQQNITKLNAFMTMLIKSLLVVLVLMLLGLSVFASFAYIVGSLIPAGSLTGPIGNATVGNWIMHTCAGLGK
jgi:hypothetical protein